MTFIAPHYWKQSTNKFIEYLNRDRFFVKTPWWLKKLYPNCIWDMPCSENEKVLYLTFDDGPHPTITPFVMEQLEKYEGRGTFFCIGDNVLKHEATYEQLLKRGHAVGNHTMNHVNGWKTNNEEYEKNVVLAEKHINSHLFRPPYGRINKAQIRKLTQQLNMKIIMWNVLAGDWINTIDNETCYLKVLKSLSNGAIIVFHDSEKAWPRLQYVLPKLLAAASAMGYTFKKIEDAVS